jgi:death-on-curing family protein
MASDGDELIVFQFEDGITTVDVHLQDETVWLSQLQMVELFERNKRTISEHIRNVFKEGELAEDAVVRKFRTAASDGKSYQVTHYNLDVIISVGYRVKSQRGTQFRIWATSVLKDHLVKGYTLNRKRLAEKGLEEARQTLALLANTLERQDLISDEGRAVLNIVSGYARTWKLLWQYDEDSLPPPAGENNQAGRGVAIGPVRQAIATLKTELLAKGEATDIFGQERGDGLSGILGAISQTFAGEDLYGSIAEKAANLLYFIIKDHPFVDGNKRIGSFLFLLFLQENQVELEIDSRAMVALTLLIAASDPTQKDLLVRLIINLLQGR